MPIRVLVCGGDAFQDGDAVIRALDAIHADKGIRCVDYMSSEPKTAIANAVYVWGHTANVLRSGWSHVPPVPSGGPDLVLVFPGESEEAEAIVRQATAAQVEVRRVGG